MEQLTSLDYRLFEMINSDLTNSVFDSVMPVLTDLHKVPVFVIALVLGLAFWIWKDRARAPKIILGLALSIVLSETISYRVIKHYVSRPRPSFTEGVTVNLRSDLHSGHSFPSLHASNNFAAATYLSLNYVRFAPGFFAVAALIGFSRIYVGVHFPADVLAGAFVGIICGLLSWLMTRKFLKVP